MIDSQHKWRLLSVIMFIAFIYRYSSIIPKWKKNIDLFCYHLWGKRLNSLSSFEFARGLMQWLALNIQNPNQLSRKSRNRLICEMIQTNRNTSCELNPNSNQFVRVVRSVDGVISCGRRKGEACLCKPILQWDHRPTHINHHPDRGRAVEGRVGLSAHI